MKKILMLFGVMIALSQCSKKSDVTDGPKTPVCRIATASNGDVIKETGAAGTQNFTYDDKPATPGDYVSYLALTGDTHMPFHNAHRLTSYQNGTTVYQFSYQADSTDRINDFSVTVNGLTKTTAYTYDCR